MKASFSKLKELTFSFASPKENSPTCLQTKAGIKTIGHLMTVNTSFISQWSRPDNYRDWISTAP